MKTKTRSIKLFHPRVDPTWELRAYYACQSPIIPDPRCTSTLDGRIEGQEYQKCEPESTMHVYTYMQRQSVKGRPQLISL